MNEDRTLSLEEMQAEAQASIERSHARREAAARRRNIISFVLAVVLALMLAGVALLGVYVF